MSAQRESGCLQARKRALTENLNLSAPWSWTSHPPELGETTCLLFQPPSLQYFFTAAQTKTPTKGKLMVCCLDKLIFQEIQLDLPDQESSGKLRRVKLC